MSTTNSSKRNATRKTYKIVLIHWGDAFIDSDDFDPIEAKNTEPCYRTTVGFLIAKNQHGYILATDTYDNEPEVAAKMFIPKGMVNKIEYLTKAP